MLFRSDDLVPISDLPLIALPILDEVKEDSFRARFEHRELHLSVDRKGNITILEDLPLTHSTGRKPKLHRAVRKNGTAYVLGDANEGICTSDKEGKRTFTRLHGYSKPSSIYVTRTDDAVIVSDVGAVRLLRMKRQSLVETGGYFAFGWPKDIVTHGENLFCADVYGVRWYQRTSS